MCDFKFSFDTRRYKSKPSQSDIYDLSLRIADNVIHRNRDNIESLAKMIGEEGCTFCPATFKSSDGDFNSGRKRKENFEQQQLFAIDFDNKYPNKIASFDDIKARADRYDLPLLFAYDTLSSENHNKFRAVFLNDNPITDVRTAETVLKALATIFPEADPQSKSAVQMYFGGKGLLYYDDTVPTISIESVIRNTANYLEDRYGANHYKRKIAVFSKETGIALNGKGLLDVSVEEKSAENAGANNNGKNLPKSSIYVDIGRKFPKLQYRINYGENSTRNLCAERRTNYHRNYRSETLGDIASVCQLYREFETGERKLHHNELFGIATNMPQVTGGEERFKALLREHAYYDDRLEKYSKWAQDLRRIKAYKPFGCGGFCPYADTCPHGANILSTLKPRPRQIERIANYVVHYVSTDEAYADFKRKLDIAVSSAKKGWHIIKAQTALGKTYAILDILKDTPFRILIVVPTNILKREVSDDRAPEKNIELTASPSLHELKSDLSRHIWDDLVTLLNSGKPTMPYIDKLISEDGLECAAVLKKYKREQDAFKESNGHAITTQKRLLTMDTSEYDLVIVDEDIIFNTVIPNKADIGIDDLKKIKKEVSPASPLARKINKVFKMIKTDEFFTLRGIPYDDAYADITMAVDIPALCSASHFCYRKDEDCISLLKPVKFNPNTKFIMVSATVDENVCGYYFGDNMTFYECANARNIGTLDQYYDRSLSRSDIENDTGIFKRIKGWSGLKHTISFKKHLSAGLYDGDLHFGNCAGCDYLKGEDIDVIGTPHQPEWIYKLFASSLPGLDFDINARIKPGTTVEHNGWRFRFMTYDDKVLRAIQFYMIESQSEQAVGRARLLRRDCKVNLYSNFPLRQANMKIPDYDKIDNE